MSEDFDTSQEETGFPLLKGRKLCFLCSCKQMSCIIRWTHLSHERVLKLVEARDYCLYCKTVIYTSDGLRVSKLLVNFLFWVNYPFNCFKHQHNLDGINFQNNFELQ